MWPLADWYHAEAVELDKSQISEVVGFKCCKCRRIKSPVCPYKTPEGKKICIKFKPLKQENSGVDSNFGTMYDSKERELSNSMVPMEGELSDSIIPMEEVSKEDNDPLLFPLASVELVTAHNSEVDTEFDATGPGPRKLPIRRHLKHEGDLSAFSGSNLSSTDISVNDDSENHSTPTVNMLPPSLQWDASVDGFNSGVTLNNKDFEYENVEFEPQTLFTFSELLGVDTLGDVPEDQSLDDGIYEQYDTGTINVQSNATMAEETATNMTICQTCSLTTPAPDLSCQNCGLSIHSHCLPSTEQLTWDDSWKCSNCQEWR